MTLNNGSKNISHPFLGNHNERDEWIWSIKIGIKNILLGKQLELRKSLTKTANKPKISTSGVNTDMLWSVFFQLFCEVIYTSMMDYATSDWVCGVSEKLQILGWTPYLF